jgi:hypothetical protein
MEPTQNPQPSPPSFTDLAGNRWPVRLSFSSVRAIRDATEIDFGQPEKFPQYWAELLADDELALKVLAVAIRSQAEARSIDLATWDEAVDGETVQNGLAALAEAVVLFTRPQKRGLVIDARDKINEYWQKAVDESRGAIADFNEAKYAKALERLGS